MQLQRTEEVIAPQEVAPAAAVVVTQVEDPSLHQNYITYGWNILYSIFP